MAKRMLCLVFDVRQAELPRDLAAVRAATSDPRIADPQLPVEVRNAADEDVW